MWKMKPKSNLWTDYIFPNFTTLFDEYVGAIKPLHKFSIETHLWMNVMEIQSYRV